MDTPSLSKIPSEPSEIQTLETDTARLISSTDPASATLAKAVWVLLNKVTDISTQLSGINQDIAMIKDKLEIL